MDRPAEKPLMEEPSYDDELLPREGSCTRHWIFPTGRKVVAEMLGTFFLMMSACGSIMAGWDIMGQALAVAFSLIMIISSLGHVSGAHLNPAISVAFAATKLFPWWQVPLYFGGQLAGGISAMLLAKLLYNAGNGAALTKPASDGWAQAFGMEVVLTFGLSFLATAMNILPNFDGFQGAVAVAFTVAVNMLLGGEISGASMNPVRSLAPAIVQSSFKGIWIYLVAPMVGAIMGAFSYKLIQIDPIYEKKTSQST